MKRPKIRNLIQNDGLTQPGRFLGELEPQFAKIDDRTIIDLLAFTWKYSDHLHFFEVTETNQGEEVQPRGTWQQLLRYEPLFYLALISGSSPVAYSRAFEDALDTLDPDHDTSDQWEDKVFEAFAAVVSLCVEVEAWSSRLPVESNEYRDLKVYIGQLVPRVEKLLALYDHVGGDRLWDLVSKSLKNWGIDRNNVPAYGPDLLNQQEILSALRNVFGEIQTIYAALVNNARQTIETSLDDDTHQAHVGLFIAFVRLLEHNRDHLNLLTGRHLDFYLRKILKLEPETRIPDRVNLTFELAKTTTRHRLNAKTACKGGKNEEKVERLYDLVNETTLSRATVTDLKNILTQKSSSPGTLCAVHAGKMANSMDGQGKALAEDNPKWPVFGKTTYPFAELGFALSSPLFRLGEGERGVTLTFAIADFKALKRAFGSPFDSADSDEVPLPDIFAARVTTAKGWYDCRPEVTFHLKLRSIKLTFDFDMDVPAIVDYDTEKLADPIPLPASWPVLRLTVDQKAHPAAYEVLRGLRVNSVKVDIAVDKVRSLVLSSDDATLKADKPFLPFGSQPRVGSAFFIGHAESFAKPLTQLGLTWRWIDPPEDIEDHYQNYTTENFQFTADVELRENYGWGASLSKTNVVLSAAADPSSYQEVAKAAPEKMAAIREAVESLPREELKKIIKSGRDLPQPSTVELTDDLKRALKRRVELSQRNAALKLGQGKKKLTPAIFKEEKKTVDDGASKADDAASAQETTEAEAVPQFQDSFNSDISGYDASWDATPFTQFSETMRQGGIRFRLKEPKFAFGHKSYPLLHSQAVAAALRSNDPNPKLLATLKPPYTPMFENIELSYRAEKTFSLPTADTNLEFMLIQPFGYSKPDTGILVADYTDEGNFYIGLADLALPQNLALLIQLAEGSGDPFVMPPREVSWSYLTANGWKKFTNAQILRDGTFGFLQSGIIEFSLPEAMSNQNPEMPQGRHWLSLTASNRTTAFDDVLALTAQAGTAVYRDEGHSAKHLATALPAGSVTKLLVRDSAIKTINQPFASYGGREAESDPEYHTRCSERLCHKDRAVGLGDYEHLVLERFSEVHKVKCLNHTCPESAFSPGNITLVLIPDLRNRNNRYPLRPAVPQSLLEAVKKYILERCSAHIDVHVVNPFYERICVGGVVHFHKGLDQGIYQKQLHEDITNGLTPWLRGEKDIHFGGRIHGSVILNLIEELDDYVDYLSEFTVTHYVGPDDRDGKLVDEVIATGGRSILVSDDSHTIQGVSVS